MWRDVPPQRKLPSACNKWGSARWANSVESIRQNPASVRGLAWETHVAKVADLKRSRFQDLRFRTVSPAAAACLRSDRPQEKLPPLPLYKFTRSEGDQYNLYAKFNMPPYPFTSQPKLITNKKKKETYQSSVYPQQGKFITLLDYIFNHEFTVSGQFRIEGARLAWLIKQSKSTVNVAI